jgi:hypothetical protein
MPDDELVGDRLAEVRRALAQHEHFYHFTTEDKLDSIRELGLDPAFEDIRSSYGNRSLEPKKALRYFTLDPEGVLVGRSGAAARAQVWDEEMGMNVPGPRAVLLRVRANSLLNRRFGLDRSHGEIRDAPADEDLSLTEYLDYVQRYGIISSYAVIPPDEVELCNSGVEDFLVDRTGEFGPL